jgi:hypothetical protein
MRVLVTGCTQQQCGKLPRIRYEPVSAVFAHGLQLTGAEVEHRPFAPGEDLRAFDAVFIGVVPFYSIAGQFVNTALMCLMKARATGVPVVFYVDDWRFTQLFSNLKSIAKNPQQLIKPFFEGRDQHEFAAAHLSLFERQVEDLHLRDWPVTLVPAFSWGDHAKLSAALTSSPDVVFADISSLAARYPGTEATSRKAEWVFGTVSNQLDWLSSLELTWPVRHYGSQTSKAPARVTEAQLVAEYHECWGVLSPPYQKILGTGWWRNRLVHAARAGAILLCDPAEAPQLGASYKLLPHAIEILSDAELRALAAEQQRAFRAQQPSAEEACQTLLDAVTLARDRR